MKLTWYGHSAYRLETGNAQILIDPFLTGNDTFAGTGLDVGEVGEGVTHIVLTHGHDDHVGDTVAIAKQSGAKLVVSDHELEQHDGVGREKLRGDRAATHVREFLPREFHVLIDLDEADLVRASLGLDGDDVMAPMTIQTYIQFVDLDLSEVVDGRPKMVLETVGRDAEEYVDQTVVSDDRQKRLFVVQGVHPDQFRRRVRDVDHVHIVARHDAIVRPQRYPISRSPAHPACEFDDPLASLRLDSDDRSRHVDPKAKGVNDVAEILGQVYPELRGRRLELIPVEVQFFIALPIVLKEDVFDQRDVSIRVRPAHSAT